MSGESAGDDATRVLSRFASAVTYDDLPATVVHQVKRSVLDTLGCGLFGSTLPWAVTLTAMLQRGASGGDVPAWGSDVRLSPGDAALANGTYAHGFELDDLHKEGRLHVGSVTLPTTLALSCLVDGPVPGTELIASQVAGYEVGARIGLASGTAMNARGFHITGVIGALTSSIAAGRLLRLSGERMQDAIGLVGSMAGGLGGAQYGSTVKRMHAGRAAQAGTYAAQLAQDGFRGIRDLFELPHGGYVGTFVEKCDRERLVAGLGGAGIVWETERLGYKPYAACAASHTSIDAILHLREQGLSPLDVERIVVHASTHSVDHVGWTYVPDTLTTAQMNLSFAVASALLDGKAGSDQFSEDRLTDPRVLDLAARVSVVPDPEIDAKGLTYSHAIRMEVTTGDGRTLTQAFDHGRGSEHWPLTDDEVVDKCRDQAGRVLPPGQVDELVAAVLALDTLEDISELTALVVPARPAVPVDA